MGGEFHMLQKVEKEMDVIGQAQESVSNFWKRFTHNMSNLLLKKGLLIAIVGFLLGRALILSEISPFALPFFASVFIMKRSKAGLVSIAVVLGALTFSIPNAGFIFGSLIMYFILHTIVSKVFKDPLKALPTTVLLASFSTRLLLTYALHREILQYDLLMAFIESGLGFILTMIFLQGVPLLSVRKRKQALKNEEIICLIILLASVMTGTVGWEIYQVNMEHVFSRYLVILFAFIGGAAIGSTVGVVTGLVLSLTNVATLYQMSLLAFTGLMGGLLKDGKKLGVSLGLMIGTLLIGLYGETNAELLPTLLESFFAMLLFFMTPHSAVSQIARFIPGTDEHSLDQQQYLQRVRDVTASKVEQFSSLFQVLSNSFTVNAAGQEVEDTKEIDFFLSNVTEKTCQACFRKSKCWEGNFNKTYEYMTEIMQHYEDGTIHSNLILQKEWEKYCVKSGKVMDTIQRELSFFQANQKLKKQVHESRRLVADQLLGVSQVMGDFAKEIQRERENHNIQEEQILDVLQTMGIEIAQVEIYSLKEGNVDIEMSIPYCGGTGECEKVIAPMLSDILGENIVVKEEECAPFPNGFCNVILGSAKAYTVEASVAHAAKGGTLISGDSYSMMELSSGKYALAISDGMGNGERAHIESKETLKLLENILQSGIQERVAIKSVNSVLSLRTTDEIFSTLDLSMIDLQNGSSKFLKIGSSPSFIKRGNRVKKIEASNLPMGIIQEFEVEVVGEQLKAGDLLIMMSDGIFEGPKHVENYDVWMMRKIREIQTMKPQEIADLLLEEVIRTRDGGIHDDMTVIVAQIQHNTPKWATIPVYSKHAQ